MNKQKSMETRGAIANKVSLRDLALEDGDRAIADVGFSTCVRVLRQNWRQGTVACKGRSDVARSNKKPWKQKGTGRARAGSARSPLWRGGGVIFGPQERSRVLYVATKVRRRAFGDLLRNFIGLGNVVSVDWALNSDKPSTSLAYKMLQNAQLHGKRINVFVQVDDVMTQASLINIPNVRLMFFDQSNVYDLANSDCWVFFKKDATAFKEMVSKWI